MGKPSLANTNVDEVLKSFRYKTTFRTRFSETDAFGHINNVSYFSYFEQARLNYIENLGLFKELANLKELYAGEGNLIVTANLECNYIAQLYYNQDIEVYVRTSKLGNSSFELEYAIVEKEKQYLAATGRGTIVYMNPKANKSEPLPSEVKEKLLAYEQNLEHKSIN